MLASIQIAVLVTAFMPTLSAYPSYLELIPNADKIGKSLGHATSGYTDFGTLFVDKGTDWASTCSMTWPGGSVTCGEALGDPCCKWTTKTSTLDYTLTEPNLQGTECKTGGSDASSITTPGTVAPGTEQTVQTAVVDSTKTNAIVNSTESSPVTKSADNAAATSLTDITDSTGKKGATKPPDYTADEAFITDPSDEDEAVVTYADDDTFVTDAGGETNTPDSSEYCE